MATPQSNYGTSPGYVMGKRQIEDTYALGTAGNTYQRSVLQRNRGQQQAQMGRQFAQQARQNPWSYARRGMLKSGAYNQALQNWAYNKNQAEQTAAQQYADAVFGNTQGQAMLEQQRSRGLEGLELSEAERIAQLAAQLRGAL